MENFFNEMFGKVKGGLCRYSMDGKIAIKTSSGYKTFDVETNKLVNCDNFAFDLGSEFFFVIPTNRVAKGDIILINGKPNAVISKSKGSIKVFSYETSAIQDIVPEMHMFMGNSYFYGKIVSLFGGMGKKSNKSMMKFMLMNQMCGGSGSNMFSNGNPAMMMLMMGGDMDNLFEGMFDEDEDLTEEEKED